MVWPSSLTNNLGTREAWLLESHISLSKRQTGWPQGTIFPISQSCNALLDSRLGIEMQVGYT